jgi:thiamine-monophosphate kinase
VSDGLVADARHVAAASNVTIAINLDRVPVVPGASPVEAAAGGEEYELLVTMPAAFTAAAFATPGGVGIARIGEVLDEDAGGGVVVTSGGSRVEFVAGYDHFFRA